MSFRRRLVRYLAIAAIAFVGLVLSAGAAVAAGISGEDQIVLSGRIDVPAGATIGQAVIFNGPVTVDGTVDGNLLALNGDVRISGEVTGDVVVVNGRVELTDGARVGGDLVTRTPPVVAPGATVVGQRRTVNTEVLAGRVAWISAIVAWIAVTVSTLVFGLLLVWFAPRAADSVASVSVKGGVWASIGWGALIFFGMPIAAIVAIVTLVGIPFGVGLLLGLALIYTLGYTAATYVFGRTLVQPPRRRSLAFLAGWATLRLVSLVPFLSGPVWFVASVFGLGTLAVAARRAGKVGTAEALLLPPPPTPAPTT